LTIRGQLAPMQERPLRWPFPQFTRMRFQVTRMCHPFNPAPLTAGRPPAVRPPPAPGPFLRFNDYDPATGVYEASVLVVTHPDVTGQVQVSARLPAARPRARSAPAPACPADVLPARWKRRLTPAPPPLLYLLLLPLSLPPSPHTCARPHACTPAPPAPPSRSNTQVHFGVDGPASTPTPSTLLDDHAGYRFLRFDIRLVLPPRPAVAHYTVGLVGAAAPSSSHQFNLPARGEAWRWTFYRWGMGGGSW
jgi:hypothetical protein